MPKLHAGKAGQAETDHGEAAEFGAMTSAIYTGNTLVMKVLSLKYTLSPRVNCNILSF